MLTEADHPAPRETGGLVVDLSWTQSARRRIPCRGRGRAGRRALRSPAGDRARGDPCVYHPHSAAKRSQPTPLDGSPCSHLHRAPSRSSGDVRWSPRCCGISLDTSPNSRGGREKELAIGSGGVDEADGALLGGRSARCGSHGQEDDAEGRASDWRDRPPTPRGGRRRWPSRGGPSCATRPSSRASSKSLPARRVMGHARTRR